jgi:prepilin-type N-terminal cleavage/methylation domain-containing protein
MKQSGFTLVELIVVIFLLGLLAAIAYDRASNMGVPECNRVFAALLNTSETSTNSRNRNNLRANDFFTRRINGPGGSPDTCIYYVINDDLIAQRSVNGAIDPRYRAIVYTPGDGIVQHRSLEHGLFFRRPLLLEVQVHQA